MIERSFIKYTFFREWMYIMKVISVSNLSLGWLGALEHLLDSNGKATHIHVAIDDVHEENIEIRHLLDRFCESKGVYPVSTVANTIFPEALYYPHNPKLTENKARDHLYQIYRQGNKIRQRCPANQHGTYFNRMIDWPQGGKTVNQLEKIISRLQSNLTRNNPLSSNYELSVGGSEACFVQDDTADIQIRHPGIDTGIMGFPCLSHISLVLDKGRLSMTALYRNQHFIRKAYGNYLGLSRLLRFICQEAGCETGELVCVASHADAEFKFGKRDISQLVKDCRGVAKSSQMVPTLI
jgi:thymidylate synthase